jgi:hypothetical protein
MRQQGLQVQGLQVSPCLGRLAHAGRAVGFRAELIVARLLVELRQEGGCVSSEWVS